MDIGYALTFIFEDRNWVSKLVPLALLALLGVIPVFGLLAVAIGLGFMTQVASNVREGMPRPLPKWDDWAVKFNAGGQVLIAMLVYNLPSLLIGSCATWLLYAGAGGAFAQTVAFMVFCCTLPIVLVYTLLTWPLLAIGYTEYIETGNAARFYRPAHLWTRLARNRGLVLRWALATMLANIAIGLLAAIPCLGWLVVLLFGYPVHGHLMGQFAHQLDVQRRARNTANPA